MALGLVDVLPEHLMYVRWTTMWHVVLPDDLTTLCGRPVPERAKFQQVPPAELWICKLCRNKR